jgi:6-methylsalicylate decarboxylase
LVPRTTARVDIHQHLWPEPLLLGLSRRREPPCLARTRAGWVLRLHGEPEALFDPADHDPDRRAALVAADGLDRALVAPSTPLGIEALPAGEAEPLLAAYHDGVADLPAAFGAWAAVGPADPEAVARLLDRGFAGACVPADALAGPEGLERLGPVLETLERRDAPLLVHPGPVRAAATTRPGWWPAMTDYVAAMQSAWHGFAVWGRPAHPRLRVCFAMLAGLAPLHRERLVARGGRADSDPGVPPLTARVPSTRSYARSASTGWSTEATGR